MAFEAWEKWFLVPAHGKLGGASSAVFYNTIKDVSVQKGRTWAETQSGEQKTNICHGPRTGERDTIGRLLARSGHPRWQKRRMVSPASLTAGVRLA